MSRTPVFVGIFIFGMSLLVESFAIIGNQFFDTTLPQDFSFFASLFIYVPAVIAGMGIGLGIGGEEEFRKLNTALSGVSMALMVDFTGWLYLQMEFHTVEIPQIGIIISLVAGFMAIIGLWIALVAYYGEE
ncbi:MAG: hypothetical protein ACXAEU_19555 [Candidatus Hodarchaeales archaeon]|jgi:hypothetical protein